MTAWVLILTLVSGYGNSTTARVEAISGFVTQEQCMFAATAWVKQADAMVRGSTAGLETRALCVPQGR